MLKRDINRLHNIIQSCERACIDETCVTQYRVILWRRILFHIMARNTFNDASFENIIHAYMYTNDVLQWIGRHNEQSVEYMITHIIDALDVVIEYMEA